MEMNARCIACLIKKQDEKIRKESDEKKKLSYMKEVLHILGNSKDEETMPWLSNQIDALYAKTFPHAVLPYAAIKKHYNEMMCADVCDGSGYPQTDTVQRGCTCICHPIGKSRQLY